jgi:hypothetical protein
VPGLQVADAVNVLRFRVVENTLDNFMARQSAANKL